MNIISGVFTVLTSMLFLGVCLLMFHQIIMVCEVFFTVGVTAHMWFPFQMSFMMVWQLGFKWKCMTASHAAFFVSCMNVLMLLQTQTIRIHVI